MFKVLAEIAALALFATGVLVVGGQAAKAGEMERNFGASAGVIQYVDGKCVETLEVTDAGRAIQKTYLAMTDAESEKAWMTALENMQRMEEIAKANGADKPSRVVCLYVGAKAPEVVRFK